jgi:D-alanyl-lipoteichoic acid acyltransferase DltB (MBOAT superfamily)
MVLDISNQFHICQFFCPLAFVSHVSGLSYTIEVYRGKSKPERHFWNICPLRHVLPQLVAGPIERPQNLLHQFAKTIPSITTG